MGTDSLLGWIAIGAAASLAGMILPFRRGVFGVVVNLLAGVGGAVLAAISSYAILPQMAPREGAARLLFAAVGALLSLGLVHVAWRRTAASMS